MTIGRPQGGAWIGKPLDLVIPLGVDNAEASGSLCLEAEVLQGDVRMDDKRVTLSLEPGPSPDTPRVHLRTTRAVEEPVVTVNLTAGCAMKSTRQYVLLADVPEPSALALAPPRAVAQPRAVAPAAPTRPARTTAGAGGDGGGASADGADRPLSAQGPAAAPPPPPPRRRVAPAPAPTPAARSADATVAPAPRPRPPAPPVAAAPAPRAEAATPRPRLRVEAMEPAPTTQGALKPSPTPSQGAGAESTLKTSPELATPPTDDASRRAEAASQWNAMTGGGPSVANEAAAREAERLKALEATLATLREQSAQTQRLLLEMKGEVEQARASRYRNPFVYGLLALLGLALIGLLLLWRAVQKARSTLWWGVAPDAKDRLPRQGELADEDDEEFDVDAYRARHMGRGQVAAVDDVEDDEGPDTQAAETRSAFDSAQVRSVNTEELYDVQQQSEFFLSLGQQDQAIEVLREHIAANPGTSALAYLDLFRLLHTLGRREQYMRLRREFVEAFNAEVPEFEQYTHQGRGLEHYPELMARIGAAWPGVGALPLIEELIFRKPGSAEEAFDLSAYRELLLLYAVARDVAEPEGSWAAPPSIRAGAATPAPVGAEAGPAAPAPSIFGNIDHGVHLQTEPMPHLPIMPSAVRRKETSDLQMDLSDLDQTAFETLRAPIEPAAKPPPTPSSDPHVIDFDPFDPATEDELRPHKYVIKR